MRTTLNVDEDVLSLAKTVAEVRGVSIGKALSDLARRGASAHQPLRERNGFYLFPVGTGSKAIGPEDVDAALAGEDAALAAQFLKASG